MTIKNRKTMVYITSLRIGDRVAIKFEHGTAVCEVETLSKYGVPFEDSIDKQEQGSATVKLLPKYWESERPDRGFVLYQHLINLNPEKYYKID
jgi:hypothetical protein